MKTQGKRSQRWPGDLMEKVHSNNIWCAHIKHIYGSQKLCGCHIFTDVDQNRPAVWRNIRAMWVLTPNWCLQSWRSVWETQSRWCCVMQRRQKSFTCSLWNTLCPACTGWRCRMTAGGSEVYREDLFFLACCLWISSICFISYLALCLHSASQRMSPAVSFQSYQPFLKGDASQLHTLRNNLFSSREDLMIDARATLFHCMLFCWQTPHFFPLFYGLSILHRMCSATAPHQRYLGKNADFICLLCWVFVFSFVMLLTFWLVYFLVGCFHWIGCLLCFFLCVVFHFAVKRNQMKSQTFWGTWGQCCLCPDC